MFDDKQTEPVTFLQSVFSMKSFFKHLHIFALSGVQDIESMNLTPVWSLQLLFLEFVSCCIALL